MLPPLFLDVEPHHRVRIHTTTFTTSQFNDGLQVMDMCAAPGSKVIINVVIHFLLLLLHDYRQLRFWKRFMPRTR